MPTQAKSAPDVIGECLNRIRMRLFVVRAAERLAAGLIMAALVAAALVMARYLRERYFTYSFLVALLPAVLVGVYWPLRMRYAALRVSLFCPVGASILTLALVAGTEIILTGIFFTGTLWMRLPLWVYCAAPLAVFAVAAVVMGRRVSPQAAAIFVDQQAALEEKVSTAYELRNRPPVTPEEARFYAPLLASAVAACQTVGTARVGYARLDRRVYLAAAVCAAVAVSITFLQPPPALAVASGTSGMTAKLAKDRDQIVNNIENFLKDHPTSGAATNPARDPLSRLLPELKDAENKTDLYDDLKRASSEMKDSLDRFSGANKANDALSGNPDLDKIARAAKDYKEAMARAGKGGNALAQDAARRDAEKQIAAAASEIADKLKNGALSEADKKKMLDTLNEAAKAAAGDPKLQEKLKEAAKALAEGNAGKFEQAMKEAGGQGASDMGDGAQRGGDIRQAKDMVDSAAGEIAKSGGESGEPGDGGGESGNPGATGSGETNAENGQPNGGNPGGTGAMAGGTDPSGHEGSGGHTSDEQHGGPGDVSHDPNPGGTGVMTPTRDPHEIANSGSSVKANGNVDKTKPPTGISRFMGASDKNNQDLVGYDSKAVQTTRERALNDIHSGRIPPQMRDLFEKFYGSQLPVQPPH